MFILEELVNTKDNVEKWELYAQYNDPELLKRMIQNKRHPERFRIVEKEVYEAPKRTERCLVFRIYDSCAAGRIEGMLMERGIRFNTKELGQCILFNVARSGLKWYQIRDLVKSVYPAKFYFTKIDLSDLQACA